MIAVGIEGRLGNQLFEYAFAHRVSTQFRTMLLIDNVRDYVLPKYFRLSNIYHYINHIPYIRTVYRQRMASIETTHTLDFSDCTINPQTILSQLQDNAYYKGYFQSATYFDTNVVSSLFHVRKKYRMLFDWQFGKDFLQQKTIVVHVRKGDYLTHGLSIGSKNADVSLPKAYYDACFRRINGMDNYQVYFIGDDMMFAKEVGKEYKNAIYVHESEIVDIQLLMNADICVISNSTFAWWGAYLNRKANKMVLAPKYFLGFHEGKEFPNGIYNKTNFEQVEI